MVYEPSEAAAFRQRLLISPGERTEVDYKISAPFDDDDNYTLKLIRHIQGMANADGGWLVLGFKGTPPKLDPNHTDGVCSSYDPTEVSKRVNSFVARGQRIGLTIYFETHPETGTKHPIIRVNGFVRLPYVCRSDKEATDTHDKILRQGAVYLRRPSAETSEVSLLVEKLCLFDRHIQQIEQALVRLVDEAEEGKYLLSIFGLGYISVAGLLAELGSFRSYHNARQMIKMAGSNPTESESAGKRSSKTPMSKKGRPGLRYCGWTAVLSLLSHNPDFRAWAKRLRERPAHANPLSGKEIMGAAVNKLLRIGFTLVKKQTFYQLPRVPQLVR